MPTKSFSLCIFLVVQQICYSQEIVNLYSSPPATAGNANWQEQTIRSPRNNGQIVLNVSNPTLAIFKPAAGKANGTAIVVCPGGAFHMLALDNEGYTIAQWLVQKGYTAIVLKYRLLPLNPETAFKELGARMQDFNKLQQLMAAAVPLAIADGEEAVKYVKTNAGKLGIDASKVGILGFSAGGTVAAGVALTTDEKATVAFSAPVYPYTHPFDSTKLPAKAPPLFIAVAADDDFKFDVTSIAFYKKWKEGGAKAELHVYAKGGHGFGATKQNLPVDHWLDRFAEWLLFLGYGAKQ